MRLEDYTTLSCLTPLGDARGWSEGDVPLQRRGVSLEWLITFVNNLQAESQEPRERAFREAEKANQHNRAGDYGLHDQPWMPVPNIPAPSLMNVHCFVEQFVKPLTQDIKAPLYARLPSQYIGKPDIFISHTWNALLVGPEQQRLGTVDALTEGVHNPKATYVWIDFVCYNQHRVESIAPDMEQVIGEIGRIGFAATPVPLLHRSWCLWELLCCERTGVSPEVFVRSGYRNDKILSVNALFRSFLGVERSRASSPRDQADIFKGFLEQFGTFEAANAHIESLLREKLAAPWFELHERDADLQFRPYPWIYDQGSDEAGRAVGIQRWRTFDPYYTPSLRESVLLGSQESVFDMLIGAGLHVSDADRSRYELETASPLVLKAVQAATAGEVPVLQELIAKGFDLNTRLLGMDLLTFAAGEGHLEAVRVLLDAGADLNSEGFALSPLRIAADKEHLDVVRLLVERGARIDAQAPDGWTALVWAASSGHAELVRYLLGMGANAHLTAGKKRTTALHGAAANGHAEVVALLLSAGVAVSPKAFNDATPLHYAVQNGHAAVATLLLDHGADICGTTDRGVTLMELATSSHMPDEILRRLQCPSTAVHPS